MCTQITWEPCENADSDLVGQGWGLRFYIFTKFPRTADAVGPGLHLSSKSPGDLEGGGEQLNISKNAFNLVFLS